MEEQLHKLESTQSESELQTVVWRDKVRKQEKELESLRGENLQLQQHCSDLQISNNGKSVFQIRLPYCICNTFSLSTLERSFIILDLQI